MSTKYTMTSAAAKRIADALREKPHNISYQRVVDTISAEGFANPHRQVGSLLEALGEYNEPSKSDIWLIVKIGSVAAYKAFEGRNACTSIMQGLWEAQDVIGRKYFNDDTD